MNNIAKQYKAKDGNLINVVYDEYAENPIHDYEDISFYCLNKHYALSKPKYNFTDYDEMILIMAKEILPDSVLNWKWIEEGLYYGFSSEENEKLLDIMHKYAYILPVYMYSHSGITINTSGFSCSWDSGHIGYIAISKRKAKELKLKKETAYDYLVGVVKSVDAYITNEVYGVLIEDESGEIIDSCFGFIGEDSIHFNGYEEKDLEEIEVNLYSKK